MNSNPPRSVIAIPVLFMGILQVAGFLVLYWLTLKAIAGSNHNWCDALDLLHRELSPKYPLYAALAELRVLFRC